MRTPPPALLLLAPSASARADESRFNLSSRTFTAGDANPAVYTCDDADRSPPLAFSGILVGTCGLGTDLVTFDRRFDAIAEPNKAAILSAADGHIITHRVDRNLGSSALDSSF